MTAVVPFNRCSMQPNSAQSLISSGVRPAVSAWLRHMKAGWLSTSPVPFRMLRGECVCALTSPGNRSRSRPSMICVAAAFVVPPAAIAAIRSSATTMSFRSGAIVLSGSATSTSRMSRLADMKKGLPEAFVPRDRATVMPACAARLLLAHTPSTIRVDTMRGSDEWQALRFRPARPS